MNLDLTQHQIDQLFNGLRDASGKLDHLHECIDDMKPRIAVMEKQVGQFGTKLDNGLNARVRRLEIGIAVVIALSSIPPGSMLVGWVASLIR